MNFEEQLGIKLSVLVSGIIGGIISLTYEQKISALRALLMIFVGGATAAYLQPSLEHYFTMDPKFSNGVGFVLGLISMRLTHLLLSLVERVQKDPIVILQVFNLFKNGNNQRTFRGSIPSIDGTTLTRETPSETDAPKVENENPKV